MESWKKILYLSWAIIFIHGIGLQVFTPFLPLYLKDLGVGDPKAQAFWSGLVVGVAPLFGGLLAPFWGTISDKYGRKPLILRTTFGISLIALFMYLSTEVYHLLLLRILQGICGGMMPAFTALVALHLPAEKTGYGLGAMQSAVFSGNIMGPFIGGLLADYLGYRNVLLLVSFFTGMAGVASFAYIHEPRRDKAKPRSKVRNNIQLVFSSASLRTVTITLFFTQFALFVVQPILPLFIVSLSDQSHPATMVGLIFAATGFATLLCTPYWGKVGDRTGHSSVLAWSLLFSSLTSFPQAFVSSAYHLLPLRMLQGFFVGGILPSTQSLIVKHTSDGERGGVLGITHSVNACGHAMGPLVGGIIAAAFGYRISIIMTSALLALVWCAFTLLARGGKTPGLE